MTPFMDLDGSPVMVVKFLHHNFEPETLERDRLMLLRSLEVELEAGFLSMI